MTKRGRFFVLLAVFLMLTAGCATKVPVNMLKPANYHEAAMAKTVAVVPFNGTGGREFASEIEGVLGSINIDDRQYFTLIDRTSLDQVMSEMKFSHSGLVDPSKAVELGKMLGAQGIYSGTVQQSFKSSYYRERIQGQQRQNTAGEMPSLQEVDSQLHKKCYDFYLQPETGRG